MDRGRSAGALLALAACIACATAAPTLSNDTALDTYDADTSDGCYYNFQHYGEGDRIMTNEPCLNCTCHNRMLMCYLRVCPFTKPIGQDCTIEKRADQCCPIITCPDVPVDLLTSTSTTSPAEYGATGVGHLDKYGCSIHGKYYPEGSKVPPSPNKPCEHCYCIRNMTTCVMQECTLHVDGCTPIYLKDVCCPVRYSCDHEEDEPLMLDHMTTTIGTTPGIKWTTTTIAPAVSQECTHGDETFPDGALIKTEKACEHCYCMKGDIVCVVQECGTPMENEGKNCTSLPPREGQCCPDTYICEGDNEITTDVVTTSIAPPRRTEEGYRKDEQVTDKIVSEPEGSGGSEEPLYPITTDVTKDEASIDYTTETSKITTDEYESGDVHHTIPQEYLPETTSTSKPIDKDSEVSSTTETGESDVQRPSEDVKPIYHTEHEVPSTPTISDKETEPGITESILIAETTTSNVITGSDLHETTDLESPNVTTIPEKEDHATHEPTDLPDKESTLGENVTEKQENLPEIDDSIKIFTTEQTEYEPTSIPKTDEPIMESSTHEPVRQETVQSTSISDVTESTSHDDASEITTKLFIGEHTATSLPDVTHDVNIITSTEIDLKDKYSTLPPKEPIEETTTKVQYEGDHTTPAQKEPSVTQSTVQEDTQKPTQSEEKYSQVTTEINVSDGLVTEGMSEKSPEKETDIPLISTTIRETDESIKLTTEKHEEPFSSETTINPFEFTTSIHKYDTQEPQVTTADIEKPIETTSKYDQVTETTSGTKHEGETGTVETPDEEKATDEATTPTSDTVHEKYTESTIEPDKGLNTIPLEPYDEDHTMTAQPEDTKQTKKPEDALTTSPTNVPDDLITKQEIEHKTTVPQTTEKSDLYTGETESTSTIQDELRVTSEPQGISSSTPNSETVEVDTLTETTTSIEHTTTDHTPKDITSEEVPVKETTVKFDSETSSDGIIVAITDKPDITENEVGEDIVPPISPPGVIPGEGSCLVDGVTYNNNSIVPSSNKCQSACKCMSSIIKCDLIQCSPPPENMMNCQSVYDSTDSCCPTYICDTIKETIPPQPHSQMAVTEPTVVESECGEDCHKIDSKQPDEKCNGEQCEVVEEPIVPQKQPELCSTESCAVSTQISPEEPTEHTPISPDMQKPIGIECTEQNGCKPEQSTDSSLPCIGEGCRRQETSQPESSIKDCKDDECKTEVSTTPVTYVTEKEKECVGDVECKKPDMEGEGDVSTEKIHEPGVSLHTEPTLSEETTSTPEGTTHKLIDESQTIAKPEEQPDIVKQTEEHKEFTATPDHTERSDSTTEIESQTEEHTIISGVADSEVKPDIVTVSPDLVTVTPQSQSTVIMSMETKATDTSDLSETSEHPHLPEGVDITQSLPTETEKSTEEGFTSPTVSPVLSEVTEPPFKPVDNLPHETESSIVEHTVTEESETDHAVSQSEGAEGAVSEGAKPEDTVTEEVVSEHGVTEGAKPEDIVTEEVVSEHGVTEGAKPEDIVTEEVVSEHGVTEGAKPEDTVTEEVVSEHGVTEGAKPEDTVTEEVVSEHGVTEGAKPEDAVTEEVVSEHGVTEGAKPEDTVTEEIVNKYGVTEGAVSEGSAATEGTIVEGLASESTVSESAATEGTVTEGAATEGAVSEGVATEGVVSEGAATEGAVSEGAATEGAVSEEVATEGVVSEGAATEGAVTEGAVSEGVATEGVVSESAATEGAVSEGAATEGAVSEGAATEGAVPEGVATERVVSEGAATEIAVSEGAATEGVLSEGAATEGAVSEGAATEGAVSEGAATEGAVSEGAATEGAVSEGAATENAVSEGAATEGAASESAVTAGVMTESGASESAVTEGVVTESAVTDGYVTKGDVTEVAVTKGSAPETSVSEGAVTEETVNEVAVTDRMESVSKVTATEAELIKDTVTEIYGTEGSITEGVVTESHITKDVTTEGTLPEDFVTKHAVTEGTITEKVVPVESITEAAVSEGGATEGAATETTVTKGITSESVATESAVTDGLSKYTGTEESATKSSISEGTVTESTPSESAATEGISIEGHVTEATSTEGVATQGIVHEDTSPESHTETKKEYSETTQSIATTSSLPIETDKDSTSTVSQPQEEHITSTESSFTSSPSVEEETSEKYEQDHDKDKTSLSPEPIDHTERIDITVTKENVEEETTDVTSEYPSLVKETTSTKPDSIYVDEEHTTTAKDLEHETPHPSILQTTDNIGTLEEKIKEPTEVTGPTTKIPLTYETTRGELEATTPKTSQEPSSDKETEIPVSVSEGTTESSVQITEITTDAFIPLKESSSLATELPDSDYHTIKEYEEAPTTEKSNVHLPTSIPETTGPQESEVPAHHTEPNIISTEASDDQEKPTTTADAVNITELPAATTSIIEDHTVKDLGITYDDSAKGTTAETEGHVQTITEQEAVEETTKHLTELEHTATPLEVTTIVSEQTVDDKILPAEPSISPPTDSESGDHVEDTTKQETATEKYDEDRIHHPMLSHEEPTTPPQISETTKSTLEQETVKADDDHKEISTSKPVEIDTSDYTGQSESDITTEGLDISPESHSELPKPLETDEEHIQITHKPEVSALPTSTEHTEIPKITATPEEEPFKHPTTVDTDKISSQSPSSPDVSTSEHVEPVESVPSSTEKQKPISTEKPTSEEIPSAEDDTEAPDQFPPSGTSGYGQEPEYEDSDQAFGPGTCRYGGKVYVSAQQIPRDDPCDFCFCFRSDIICLQQSCPPPIHGCHEEPIQGFCCPRYECPVSMATSVNMTTTTTTTTTTLPPHFLPHAYHGAAQRKGCQIKGHSYEVGEVVRASSGPCLHCTCGGDGQMKCDPKICTPEPMLRQMIAAAVSSKRRR